MAHFRLQLVSLCTPSLQLRCRWPSCSASGIIITLSLLLTFLVFRTGRKNSNKRHKAMPARCQRLNRSAPKGRQQMRETGFCKNLRFSAVSCENLRFPAVFCANLRLPNPLIYRASRKSAKICKNLRKCAFRVRFLPFAVSLFGAP